ncbi:MAG: hypothetical protein KDA68_08170 [Planctomycetaceae bacterium]|nr:hypothetical protein [Planctomycetaceae bacterium]
MLTSFGLKSFGRWVCLLGLLVNVAGFVAYGVWHREHQAELVRHYQWNAPVVSIPEDATWDVRLTKGQSIFSGFMYVHALVMGDDGKWLIMSGDRGAEAWDLSVGEMPRAIPPSRAANSATKESTGKWAYPRGLAERGNPLSENGLLAEQFSFGESGDRVMGFRVKGMPRIWNLETGEIEEIGFDHRYANNSTFGSAAWSPDERTCYFSGAVDLTIGVYRAESGTWEKLSVDESRGPGGPWHWYDHLEQIRLSDDGTLIAAAGFSPEERRTRLNEEKSDIYVLDSQSGKPVQRLREVAKAGTFQFSRDGEWIVVGGADGSIDYWNVKTGEKKQGFSGMAGEALQDFAISPDGKLIVTLSTFSELNRNVKKREAYLQVWDAETGKEQLRLTSPMGTGKSEFAVANDWSRLAWWVSPGFGRDFRRLPGGDRMSIQGQVWVWEMAAVPR